MITNSDASQAAVLHLDRLIVEHGLMIDAYPTQRKLEAFALAAIAQDRAARAQAEHCQCPACAGGVIHASDCSVHNMPAMPNGPCDCGVESTWKAEESPYREFYMPAARAQGAGEAVGVVMNRVKDGITHKVASLYISGKDLPLGTQLYAALTIPQAAEVPGFVPEDELLADFLQASGTHLSPGDMVRGELDRNDLLQLIRAARDSAAPTPTASAPKAEGEEVATIIDQLVAERDAYKAMLATQPPSEADRTREGGDVDSEGAAS